MAKEEIEFIMGLRNIEDIHNIIIEDPKRALELISKRLDY